MRDRKEASEAAGKRERGQCPTVREAATGGHNLAKEDEETQKSGERTKGGEITSSHQKNERAKGGTPPEKRSKARLTREGGALCLPH